MKYLEKNVPDNLRVQVQHHRGLGGQILWTSAKLIDTTSGFSVGDAIAQPSKKDRPSRKIGRAVAVGRALKNYLVSVGQA